MLASNLLCDFFSVIPWFLDFLLPFKLLIVLVSCDFVVRDVGDCVVADFLLFSDLLTVLVSHNSVVLCSLPISNLLNDLVSSDSMVLDLFSRF